MPCTHTDIQHALQQRATPERKRNNMRFFKTGTGEYGEGDVFIGVSVPDVRSVVRMCNDAPHSEIALLLESAIHEHRLAGLLLLVQQYTAATRRKDARAQKEIAIFYKKHIARVNNWDLVDTSAWQILGEYTRLHGNASLFETYARSRNMWKRRIAVVSTFAYIRNGECDTTLHIAKMLLHDTHDLLHKATGWMLREVGKKEKTLLETFLACHAQEMPRTMLRYAIERFPEGERKLWLEK